LLTVIFDEGAESEQQGEDESEGQREASVGFDQHPIVQRAADGGDAVAEHIGESLSFSLCVLYLNDTLTAELVAANGLGDAWSLVRGLRIPIGQWLSGWVAANRQLISNSDPTLDLGATAQALSPWLRSCLSVPVLFEDELLGVLTLYSITENGFDHSHQHIAEKVAHHLARILKLTGELETRRRAQRSSKFVQARQPSATTRTA